MYHRGTSRKIDQNLQCSFGIADDEHVWQAPGLSGIQKTVVFWCALEATTVARTDAPDFFTSYNYHTKQTPVPVLPDFEVAKQTPECCAARIARVEARFAFLGGYQRPPRDYDLNPLLFSRACHQLIPSTDPYTSSEANSEKKAFPTAITDECARMHGIPNDAARIQPAVKYAQ